MKYYINYLIYTTKYIIYFTIFKYDWKKNYVEQSEDKWKVWNICIYCISELDVGGEYIKIIIHS